MEHYEYPQHLVDMVLAKAKVLFGGINKPSAERSGEEGDQEEEIEDENNVWFLFSCHRVGYLFILFT